MTSLYLSFGQSHYILVTVMTYVEWYEVLQSEAIRTLVRNHIPGDEKILIQTNFIYTG